MNTPSTIQSPIQSQIPSSLKNTIQRKIGFWSVISLVIGSQIGSGIFLLPASLSSFGALGLMSWGITAVGALLLALVFAELCRKIPKTGGPHNYVEATFGKSAGFFCAWTYWVISWLSTPTVVIAVVGYLSPVLGNTSAKVNLLLELFVLLLITSLNLKGIKSSSRMEFVFTLLKILPLVLVPIAGLSLINMEHFTPINPTSNSTLSVINGAALLTLWGFIGVESATTPAESVHNPSKTIPRAIVFGTLIVALVYIISSFVVMAIVPPAVLSQSKAPFAEAATLIFGGHWHIIISIAASIVCLGTLNAWILTSGQIALGAANDGHFPKLFATQNSKGAPLWSLIISAGGVVPMLILTMNENLVDQVNSIIDISVTAFLFVYAASVLSYLKLSWQNPKQLRFQKMRSLFIGMMALIFCGWALWSSGIKTVGLASLVIVSGIPVYWWRRNKMDSIPEGLEARLFG
jgi:APA family basic amino acid/polyamine antiporter